MRLSLYTVDSCYCEFLRQSDPNVVYAFGDKERRPFIGIVFSINGFQYYAPFTSPKPKHLRMKNKTDFLKINDGKWGAINFNKMIPVPRHCLYAVDYAILDTDSKSDIAYKHLLIEQLTWCNRPANADVILRTAARLYDIITTGKADIPLQQRCCDFRHDEQQCLLYESTLQGADHPAEISKS